MPIVTFTTDFGLADTYVGQMHGVALSIAPQARLIDLTHLIKPQNIRHGAAALEAAVDAFPPDTIHVGVIDPGVGSSRAGIAIASNAGPLFVGPDNGLFDLALTRLGGLRKAVRLETSDYRRPHISATFHGRDIFTPAAAHLATGVTLDALGPSHHDLVSLNLPAPAREGNTITAQVLYIDHFGNAITTLRRDAFPDLPWDDVKTWQVTMDAPRQSPLPLGRTFSDVEVGRAIAYFGSSNRLELAIRNGNFAQQHNARQSEGVLVAHH